SLGGGRGVATAGDTIAVIPMDGAIAGTGVAPSVITPDDFYKQLQRANDDDSVKAIVLRVNSPGGTPVAAEEIISQMQRTRAVKPIVVSMGDIATSAAYYISSQSDRIVANPDTFTGSIGVIWTFKNKSQALSDEGISVYVAKTGNFKDMGSEWRGLTMSEKEYVNAILNESYDRFVTSVAKGRNMSVDKVKSIADGRVYTGNMAKDMGLVDELGGLYDAISVAKNMSNTKGKITVVYMNEPAAK
ncbi:MAG TPA: signal peptide peptidase SppA, partial [Methanocella sp.]|nr:signal peptide peptidase SppA [Methanocella sp.]